MPVLLTKAASIARNKIKILYVPGLFISKVNIEHKLQSFCS